MERSITHANAAVAGAMLIWLSLLAESVFAQLRIGTYSVTADETAIVGRARIAAAADGSSAVAWETLRIVDGSEVEQIAVQRYSPEGAPIAEPVYFSPEIGCVDFDIWTRNYLQNADIAFLPSGELLVVMSHVGLHNLAGQDAQFNSEVTLGIVGSSGEIIDAGEQAACVQLKLLFRSSPAEDERPRLAVTPQGLPLFTADGFFDDHDSYGEAQWRNAPVSIIDPADLKRIVEFVPHDDPASLGSIHAFPDISAGGDVVLSTWHDCPVVDGEGNANDCDIRAQFYRLTDAGMQPIGGNQHVNDGDSAGTLNFKPSAATNSMGESVLVWLDLRSGQSGDVFGQRYDADGSPDGANFRITTGEGIIVGTQTDGAIFAERPDVAVLDDGRFMVVWTEIVGGKLRARGRQFGASGAPEGLPFDLAEGGDLQTLYPDVSGHGNRFLSAWTGASANGSTAVFTSDAGRIVRTEEEHPAGMSLGASVLPNPSSGPVIVRYNLPQASHVVVTVHDILGREVAVLLDEQQPPGNRRVTFNAEPLAAGTYFFLIAAGGLKQTLSLALIH